MCDAPLVVVAEEWPSALMAVLALDLPLRGAYFPPALHDLFKPSNPQLTWSVPGAFNYIRQRRVGGAFLISGSPGFVRQFLGDIRRWDRVVVHVGSRVAGYSARQEKAARNEGVALINELGLDLTSWKDSVLGGVTTGTYCFGFGQWEGRAALPQANPSVERRIGHYLDPMADTRGVETVPLEEALRLEERPSSASPVRATLESGTQCLLPQGLLPLRSPQDLVLCPSAFHPGRRVVRKLTLKEHLRIHQQPVDHDAALLARYEKVGDLPFSGCPPPGMWMDILRQLWSRRGGGLRNGTPVVDCKPGVKKPNRTAPTAGAEGSGWGTGKMVDRDKNGDRPGPACPDITPVSYPLESLAKPAVPKVEDEGRGTVGPPGVDMEKEEERGRGDPGLVGEVGEGVREARAGEVVDEQEDGPGNSWGKEPDLLCSRSESSSSSDDSESTSVSGQEGLDLETDWEFEFAPGLDLSVPTEGGGHELEDSTATTLTCSGDETVATGTLSSRVDPHDPAPHPSDGPPFAVGDTVVADPSTPTAPVAPQRGCVMEANHPWYVIHLEGGHLLRLNCHKNALFPGRLDGKEDRGPEELDAVARGLEASGKLGSFGIQIDSQLHSLRRIVEEKRYAKAAKADDAEVPVYLWNQRIDLPPEKKDRILDLFREWGHRMFVRALRRDASQFMAREHGPMWATKARRNRNGSLTKSGRDQHAICGMLWHATNASWFDYRCGSRLIHFRFPLRYREMARDGVPVFFTKEGPTTRSRQPRIPDPGVRAKVREKIEKVLVRGYMLTTGLRVASLLKYFAVPKGEHDIRMVYDGTANGLNECCWAPTFWLPTLESLVRALDSNSWMTDRDVADMFLNYQLHASVRPFTGVDLAPAYEGETTESLGNRRWAFWDRNLMGFVSSPYNSIKMALVVEEVAKGNRHEVGVAPPAPGKPARELNPFQWARVRLNIPGSRKTSYDPRVPWISKLRLDGRIASDLFSFVDDERVAGATRELAWQASHRLACIQSYLGVMDAPRKVRPVSRTPGAWAGAVVHILEPLGVCTLTSEEKWAKMKLLLRKWWDHLEAGEEELTHKELVSDRGFLVYVTQTYPTMIPFLKGFHLSAEMWRGGRNADGYRLRGEEDDASAGSGGSLVTEGEDAGIRHHLSRTVEVPLRHAPPNGRTRAVPRLRSDLQALLRLTNFDLPPLRVVRPSLIVHVYYGFGDASGKQYGSTKVGGYEGRSRIGDVVQGPEGVRYRLGVWSTTEEKESSNFKELTNLVASSEEEAEAGRLSNCEYFLFTDNETAEASFNKGSSSSPLLHDLVTRLKLLEMRHGMTTHVVHVAGTRMIAQGTDGCSRGSLMEGVMAGRDMLAYLELDRTALERCPALLEWIREWTCRPALEPLTLEEWFVEGHGIVGGTKDGHGIWIPRHGPSGNLFLWAPPPAVADAALEELAKARHKRTDTFHVVVVPRLMRPRWRRLFHKLCDFAFIVPPTYPFWPASMHEPAWVGVVLPFTHHRPWCFKRVPLLVDMERDLRGMLKAGREDAGSILRKLLLLPGRISSLPTSVARGVLRLPGTGGVSGASDTG